ncbi:hypothetical protein MM710_37275, partial [Klebsiella pneumoniae]|nr:hypothetical protein [Klebsiella pneumoniae]
MQSAPQPAAPAAENKAVPAPAPQSPAASPSGTRSVGGIVWQRPTQGKVVADFGGNNKGVDIAGNAGQPVLAALPWSNLLENPRLILLQAWL